MINIILKSIEQKGVKKSQLARELGVKPQLLNNWFIRDKKIPNKYIDKVCELLEIDKYFLITGKMPENNCQIDILDVKASAGNGLMLFDENIIKTIGFNKDNFEKLFNFGYKKDLKIIGVDGDSMSPTFNDKDLLIVDTTIDNVSDGVWVFRIDNTIYVKRLQKTPNRVIAISDNKAYRDFDLPNNAEVVARVITVFKYERI